MTKQLRKWAEQHLSTMTGHTIALAMYNPKNGMNEICGFQYIGEAYAAIQRMKLKPGEYILMYPPQLTKY